MSKSLTRTEINEKKIRRLNDKSLRQLLIHRFINAYVGMTKAKSLPKPLSMTSSKPLRTIS